MKKNILAFIILIMNLLSLPLFAQNDDEPIALGLPGDNLNLYAVLDIFQKSPTLETFEKSINDKDTKINNLDLNNDNAVDYVNVVSYKEGDGYSIVLRVAINNRENQDVAVIEVNKNSDGKVIIQIIGDKELYGKNYIIEPTTIKDASGTTNPGYVNDDIYYANDWPIINFMFSPGFVLYHSPWYWGYYPPYWNPWSPIFYYDYWGFHRHYYHNFFFRRFTHLRQPVHYNGYINTRNRSNIVIRNRRNGNYNRTYDGRTYRRPDAVSSPRGRNIIPNTRGEAPRTQQATPRTRGEAPRTQQATPRTRGEAPRTQQATPKARGEAPKKRSPRQN